MPAVNNKSKRTRWSWQSLPALVCYAIKIMSNDGYIMHPDWMAIQSAPKDGTKIMATGRFYSPITIFWGTYHPNAKGEPCWRVDGSRHKFAPTHWTPLMRDPNQA
jgi:hypothetical protein